MGSRMLTEQGYADDVRGMVIGEPTGGNLVYATTVPSTITSIPRRRPIVQCLKRA